jgi:hypothetical protein
MPGLNVCCMICGLSLGVRSFPGFMRADGSSADASGCTDSANNRKCRCAYRSAHRLVTKASCSSVNSSSACSAVSASVRNVIVMCVSSIPTKICFLPAFAGMTL